MKMIILLALFALVSAKAHSCDMPGGFHEFETFGENSIYLSHYPMFGSIHSYQIVLKADLIKGGKNVSAEFLSFRKNNPGMSFSTSPIRSDGEEAYAVLPDYAVVGANFNARVHYQNKKNLSVDFMKDVTVQIKEVIVNRLMNQPAVGVQRPQRLSYLYFGDQKEAYLLHMMHWNPDFDQIVQIKPLTLDFSKCAGPIVISNRKNDRKDRVISKQSVAAVSSCGDNLNIDSLNEIYNEEMTIQH